MPDHLERLRDRRDAEAFKAGALLLSAGAGWLLMVIAIVGALMEHAK